MQIKLIFEMCACKFIVNVFNPKFKIENFSYIDLKYGSLEGGLSQSYFKLI